MKMARICVGASGGLLLFGTLFGIVASKDGPLVALKAIAAILSLIVVIVIGIGAIVTAIEKDNWK